jgi:hypothetical protein
MNSVSPHGLFAFVTALLGLALTASPAGASSEYLDAFNSFAGSVGTRLDTCGVCHNDFDGVDPSLNPYGAAFGAQSTHATDPTGALVTLQFGDQDGDGATSFSEVPGLMMPGWSCANLGAALNAPPDLVEFAEAGQVCPLLDEAFCFDGADDDGDGLVDCEDPDCDGSTFGSCDTGSAGICAAGTITCSGGAETCLADLAPQPEGPPGDWSCTDGLDSDCDGLIDSGDPDCQLAAESACFDGLDDDADGLVDCADPDCAGAVRAGCDTGEPGICAPGALVCNSGIAACVADRGPESEGPYADATCGDGLDNDCDNLVDGADPQCQQVTTNAAVRAIALHVPRLVWGSTDSTQSRRVVAFVKADGEPTDASVEVLAKPMDAVSVEVEPASSTRHVVSTRRATRFHFNADFTCNEAGVWLVEWSANVVGGTGDDQALTGTTYVWCHGKRHWRGGRGAHDHHDGSHLGHRGHRHH